LALESRSAEVATGIPFLTLQSGKTFRLRVAPQRGLAAFPLALRSLSRRCMLRGFEWAVRR